MSMDYSSSQTAATQITSTIRAIHHLLRFRLNLISNSSCEYGSIAFPNSARLSEAICNDSAVADMERPIWDRHSLALRKASVIDASFACFIILFLLISD